MYFYMQTSQLNSIISVKLEMLQPDGGEFGSQSGSHLRLEQHQNLFSVIHIYILILSLLTLHAIPINTSAIVRQNKYRIGVLPVIKLTGSATKIDIMTANTPQYMQDSLQISKGISLKDEWVKLHHRNLQIVQKIQYNTQQLVYHCKKYGMSVHTYTSAGGVQVVLYPHPSVVTLSRGIGPA